MTDSFLPTPEENERDRVLTGKKALQRLKSKTEFQEPHKHPWDRLMGEPMQWFARFELYRKLPPDQRSIPKAYAEYQRSQKKDPSIRKVTPSTWQQTASRWRWKPRAEAWDAWQIQQDRVAFDEERRRERKKRIEVLSVARELLSTQVLDLVENPDKVKEMSFGNLLKALALVMREQRTEFGEVASIQRTEVTGVGGGPVAQQIDVGVSEMAVSRILENMSLEELQVIRGLREKMLGDGANVIDAEVVVIEGGIDES